MQYVLRIEPVTRAKELQGLAYSPSYYGRPHLYTITSIFSLLPALSLSSLPSLLLLLPSLVDFYNATAVTVLWLSLPLNFYSENSISRRNHSSPIKSFGPMSSILTRFSLIRNFADLQSLLMVRLAISMRETFDFN